MLEIAFTPGHCMILQTTSSASSDFAPEAIGTRPRRGGRGGRGGRTRRGGRGAKDLTLETQRRLEELQRRRTDETVVCFKLQC